VFGPTLFVMRATSSILLGLSAALAVLLLFRIRPGIHPAWGLLVGGFVALTPEVFPNSVLCMLEIPGLCLSLLSVWLYHRFLEDPSRKGRGLAVGLALVALLFVKYPYGAYIYAPIALHEAIRVRFHPMRLLSPSCLAVWGPFVAFLGLWLAIPQSRSSIMRLLADAPDAVQREGGRDPGEIPYIQWDLVLYYLKTLVWKLSPGWLLGMLALLGSVVYGFVGGRFGRVVILGSIVWTVFTLTLSFRTFGVDRFLVPLAGSFAVAGVAGLASVADILRRRVASPSAALIAIPIVILSAGVIHAGWELRRLPDWAGEAVETGAAEAETVSWIHSSISAPANLFIVGAWDQVNEHGIEVDYMLKHAEARDEDLDIKAVRLGRIFNGTERVERWFGLERHWNPERASRRRCYVLLVEPSARLTIADPDGFATSRAEAIRRLGSATLLARRRDEFGDYVLYDLGEVRAGGD
jgi:hypothetical protein